MAESVLTEAGPADLAGAREAARLARRSVAAATVGNALEFYDFVTYAFFSIQIGHAFFPGKSAYVSLMLSLATFGAGFITRPIGGIIIGAYADRVGRRPAMMLSFTMMGVAIIALALIPPYAQIGVAAPILAVVARMVQGFSLGGEVGPDHGVSAGSRARASPRARRLLAGGQPGTVGGGRRGGGLRPFQPVGAGGARRLRLARRLPAGRRDAAVRAVAAAHAAGDAACA